MEAWFCEKGAAIVMEALDETVSSLFDRHESVTVRMMILGSVMGLLYRLHAMGIAHGDAHLDNIMVKETPMTEEYIKSHIEAIDTFLDIDREYGEYGIKRYKYYFIDMGQSIKTSDSNVLVNDYWALLEEFQSNPANFIYDEFLQGFIKTAKGEINDPISDYYS